MTKYNQEKVSRAPLTGIIATQSLKTEGEKASGFRLLMALLLSEVRIFWLLTLSKVGKLLEVKQGGNSKSEMFRRIKKSSKKHRLLTKNKLCSPIETKRPSKSSN